MALFAFIAMAVDAQFRAEVRAELQLAANAAAVGSVADLPKGAVAVFRTAGHIIGSRKARPGLGRGCEQKIEIGHWDAAGRSFSTGAANAVRITIRVRSEQGLFGPFTGSSQHQTEARAVAIVKPLGNALVAEECATTVDAVR
jgi:Putative Tad-like Flp pilus-assembly